MNRPLPIAFVLFIAGIAFAHRITVSFTLIIVLAALFFILFLSFTGRFKRLFYVVSAVLVFILGIAAYLNFNNPGPRHISHLLKEEPKEYYIQGDIASSPEYYWGQGSKRKASFLIKAIGYKNGAYWLKLEGISEVNIKDTRNSYCYGDRLIILGSLKSPRRAGNPGEFDYAQYLKSKRIYTVIDVRSDDDLILLEKARPFLFKKLIFGARSRIEGLIDRYLPYPDSAVLGAMLIGQRSHIPKDLSGFFIKTGTAHILSISGLHVAIIAAVLFFIIGLLGIPRKASCILTVGFLFVYASLAGGQSPILRAAIMISVSLLAYLLERDFDIYSALSLSGIIILMVNPMQAFDAGFILSFSCVFSIVYLIPKLESRFNTADKNKFIRYIFGLIFVSFVAYIGSMPLIAYYFNIVSPVTILANFFVVPLLGVFLLVGILFAALAGLSNFLGTFLAYILHLIFLIFTKIITLFSDIPFAYFYIPDIPLYVVAAYYIFLLAAINSQTIKLKRPWIFIMALLAINIFIWRPFLEKDKGELRVTFLDVRGGDTVFLEFPGGKTMLINCGQRIGYRYNEAESIVIPFLFRRGIKDIDLLYLTRSSPSYMNAASEIFKKQNVGYFLNGGSEIKKAVEVGGLGNIKLLIDAPSRIQLFYRDIKLLISPGENYLYVKDRPRIIVNKNKISKYNAIAVITDGFNYSVENF